MPERPPPPCPPPPRCGEHGIASHGPCPKCERANRRIPAILAALVFAPIVLGLIAFWLCGA
jgi:hypothetical protein